MSANLKRFSDELDKLPAEKIPDELEKQKKVLAHLREEEVKERKHSSDGREARAKEFVGYLLVFGPLVITVLLAVTLGFVEIGMLKLPHHAELLSYLKPLGMYSLANMQAFAGTKQLEK